MPKSIYVRHVAEQPNSNSHYLNRLVKLLNHFISIEPEDKPKGFECHHIVPKSWKPEWSKESDNLLKVPAKAHYVIHHLMYKAFPDNYAMMHAFHRIIKRFNLFFESFKITAKVYSTFKLNLKFSKEHKMKIALSNTGKTKSQYTKDKISRTKKEKAYTPWNKGLTKETDERVKSYGQSLSIATQGRVPWNKGVPHSEETKKKIGLANSKPKNKNP